MVRLAAAQERELTRPLLGRSEARVRLGPGRGVLAVRDPVAVALGQAAESVQFRLPRPDYVAYPN